MYALINWKFINPRCREEQWKNVYYSESKMMIFVQQLEQMKEKFTLIDLKVSLKQFCTFDWVNKDLSKYSSISCYLILHSDIALLRKGTCPVVGHTYLWN